MKLKKINNFKNKTIMNKIKFKIKILIKKRKNFFIIPIEINIKKSKQRE